MFNNISNYKYFNLKNIFILLLLTENVKLYFS